MDRGRGRGMKGGGVKERKGERRGERGIGNKSSDRGRGKEVGGDRGGELDRK